jgi:hypothetical protein
MTNNLARDHNLEAGLEFQCASFDVLACVAGLVFIASEAAADERYLG